MEYILVDTTVWIDYYIGSNNQEVNILIDLLNDRNSIVSTCPIIVQEVLQGFKSDKEFKMVQDDLLLLNPLEIDSYVAAIEAAILYRELRKKGLTIRKPNDCLIAYYAIAKSHKLLHRDKDFKTIASASHLQVF